MAGIGSWRQVNRQEFWLVRGEEVGNGRAEGLNSSRKWKEGCSSLMPDGDGEHISIFENSQT